ncbi:MAG TPA: class I SAM-dependent methyltransferase [Pantanalinema sp.]
MTLKELQVTNRIHDYMIANSLREPEVLRRLREETERHPRAQMQISAMQGQFMRLLIQLLGAKKTLEVGVFTGYSSLSVALALPEDAQIIACDVSEEYTAVARRYWAEAGVAHKIDLRLAPALETLDALVAQGHAGTFDFAFIDADKENDLAYYERALTLARPGGLIAIDNVLWSGSVADPSDRDESTEAIRALNRLVHHDERVDMSMLPVADGLTLARKR